MSDSGKNRSNKFASEWERLIFEELQYLPKGYEVVREPDAIRGGASDVGKEFSYRPDFSVRDSMGHCLVIEVKSDFAMTLPNVIKFSEIDRMIRLRPKWRFLLVLFDGRSSSSFTRRAEFSGLNVHYFRGPFELREIVESEFAAMISDD